MARHITLISETHMAQLEVRLERKESCAPHLSIDLRPCKRYTELSISATIWHGRREYSAGQCVEDILELFGAKYGEPLAELCSLWKRWHLNGIKCGTKAQSDAVADLPVTGDWFGAACRKLSQVGLLEDRSYKFGSAWLVEPLPQPVVAKVGRLCTALGAPKVR